jgi:hypothetical protein
MHGASVLPRSTKTTQNKWLSYTTPKKVLEHVKESYPLQSFDASQNQRKKDWSCELDVLFCQRKKGKVASFLDVNPSSTSCAVVHLELALGLSKHAHVRCLQAGLARNLVQGLQSVCVIPLHLLPQSTSADMTSRIVEEI